jgi:hypothetical protein
MLREEDITMITIKNLVRSRQRVSQPQLAAETGAYDHGAMKRWRGKDTALIRLTMKSSTSFDGEASNNEGDRGPF